MNGIAANNEVLLFRDMPCRTYEEAKALLDAVYNSPQTSNARFIGGRVCITKAVEGNVFLHSLGDVYISVILYDTEIVRYYPDGTFSVDNGGFNTPTTATRISQFTPDGYSARHSDKRLHLNGSKIPLKGEREGGAHSLRFPNVRPVMQA